MASIWDEGDIAAAVTKAKKLGAIFLVFVEGNDEVSTEYRELFNNDAILAKLNTEQFVSIKIQENSVAHQQFNAIYPTNSIPSIYFIGKNGKPLDILTSKISLEDFQKYIDNILEKGGITVQKDSSASLIQSEKQSDVAPNDVPTTSADATQSSPVEQTPDLSPEKKIQHARELIEQRKEEKMKQEKEDERLKEIERRKMGQNVQQMKKWQQDEELKQLKESRDREKKENQAARDRVLAQIAQDKAERAARFSKQSSPPPTSNLSQSPSQSSRPVPRGNTTRLQFRMPDGSVHTHEFQNDDILETVHHYIRNEMNLPFSNYTISTTFPRVEFTENDNCQTLLDLQLVPNAVLLILPQHQGVVDSGSTSSVIGNVFMWLLAPLFSVYDIMLRYFFGRPPPASVTNASIKRSSSDVDESNRNVPKRQAGSTSTIKRQGNIHRLTDRQDTDDENNTWNGNSTQQM